MSLSLTLALLALGAALCGLFGWLGARPRPLGRPRLAPWPLMMMFAATATMLILVHLLNLLGLRTGGPRAF